MHPPRPGRPGHRLHRPGAAFRAAEACCCECSPCTARDPSPASGPRRSLPGWRSAEIGGDAQIDGGPASSSRGATLIATAATSSPSPTRRRAIAGTEVQCRAGSREAWSARDRPWTPYRPRAATRTPAIPPAKRPRRAAPGPDGGDSDERRAAGRVVFDRRCREPVLQLGPGDFDRAGGRAPRHDRGTARHAGRACRRRPRDRGCGDGPGSAQLAHRRGRSDRFERL